MTIDAIPRTGLKPRVPSTSSAARMPPRILIVTAAFGEGHNSAARNLERALQTEGARVRVCDPCLMSAPWTTAVLSRGYRFVTNYLPTVWEWIYRSTNHRDFSRKRLPLMRKPERCLARLVREFRPHAVVSTYPIYPYFLARAFPEASERPRAYTVVTDSLEINAAWLRAPSDRWLVTDAFTRDRMMRLGGDISRISETGFPVHPDFAELRPVEPDDRCDPFRVLYFPTARRRGTLERAEAILEASPAVTLTLALGKNFRRLHRLALEIERRFPGRVRTIGWTRNVPKLLTRHHLVVGKAGGATVHEAIAARCPMLIHHLVPGQEEGNLELLEKIGGGTLVPAGHDLRARVADMLADHASGWRTMKRALARHGHHAGAIAAARLILRELGLSGDTPERPDPGSGIT